ncbi:MAG: ankyrin repeat domain-containing protein [Akkermansia sp.]|nr:ankyrin repeat domain-containing protein [Akkermansia sp.]
MPVRIVILFLCVLMLPACRSTLGQQQAMDRQLMQSAESIDNKCIDTLLRNGANPNTTVRKGETALGLLLQHYKRSHADRRLLIDKAAEQLLRHGAEPDALHHGFTPLQIATGQGSAAIVASLIRHGANPSLETKAGLAPIWQAVYSNDQRIGFLLLQAGANPNAQNTEGQTPLQYLRSQGLKKTELMLHLQFYGGH